MAHLWVQNHSGDWVPIDLDGEGFAVTTGENGRLRIRRDDCLESLDTFCPMIVRRQRLDLDDTWILLSSKNRVRVNGMPVLTGFKVLSDRDEIGFESLPPVYFSTEQLARIVPFPGTEHETICPRCQTPIADGHPAVQCPNPQCRTWYHQSDDLPGYTYHDTCCLCGWPSTLTAEYQWRPELQSV